MAACFVFLTAAVIGFLNWQNVNSQQKEKERHLVVTGYYHLGEDPDTVTKKKKKKKFIFSLLVITILRKIRIFI